MNTPAHGFPTAKVSGRNSRFLLLNAEAVKLLRQNGANKVAILEEPGTGIISLKPLEIPNCVAVVNLHEQSESCWQPRVTFSHRSALYDDGAAHQCVWDDANGQLIVSPAALPKRIPKRKRICTTPNG